MERSEKEDGHGSVRYNKKNTTKKDVGMKAHRFNDDVFQPGGALDR